VDDGRRLASALVVSALLHGFVLTTIAFHPAAPLRPALVAIPVALVGRPGGGGGGPGPDVEPPAAAAAPTQPAPPAPAPVVAAPAPVPKPPPHPTRMASRTPPPRPAPPPSVAPSAPAAGAPTSGSETGTAGIPGGGGGGGGSGSGGGGGGGDGSGGARVAYGTNPLPPYPNAARRLGMEGVVLLDVLVAPDGSAADVRVRRSSGFPLLDESALTTVRQRWRFIPARRGDTPVESRVTVPIRFRLADAPG